MKSFYNAKFGAGNIKVRSSILLLSFELVFERVAAVGSAKLSSR